MTWPAAATRESPNAADRESPAAASREWPASGGPVVYTPSTFMLFTRAHGSATTVAAATTTVAFQPPGAGSEYGSPGAGSAWGTEARVLAVAPVGVTLSKMMNRTWANTLTTATMTFRCRNNGANGNQINTVAAGSTASVEDATNTDAITAGNTFATTMQSGGSGSGTYTAIGCRMLMTPTTDTTKHWALYSMYANNTLNQGATRFFSVTGFSTTSATYDPAAIVWRCASTIESVRIPPLTNSLNVTATFELYKNGVATGLTATVTAGSTTPAVISGPLTLADGDTFAIAGTAPAGTGSMTFANSSVWVSCDRATPKAMMMTMHLSGETFSTSGTTHVAIAGSMQTDETTESRVSIPHGFTGKSSKLAVNITGNVGATTTVVTYRVGGASTALSVTVPQLGTGIYTDLVDEVTWGPTDECSYGITRTTTDSLTIRSITTVEEYVSG